MRIGDEGDQRRHIVSRPVAAHQGLARRAGVRRGPDQADHLVDVGDRDGEADLNVGGGARLGEPELRAPGHDLLAEVDEGGQEVLEIEHLRPAAVQRDHVGAEGGLQLAEPVELVQHHVRDGVALQLDHDAHAVAVGFVAHLGDALDALVAHRFGDLLLQGRLVDLVGDLVDDQRRAVAADFLGDDLRPHHDRAAPGRVGGADAGAAQDGAAGREVRPRHDRHQLLEVDLGPVHHGQRRVDHLAEVVRRDVGRHADRDAAGAVDEQVRIACRQDDRLLLLAVVIVLEVDGVLVDVLDQRQRGGRQTRFGVAHRRRRIAVDRSEVALTVDQRQAHRERLRHADERVVDRAVAVRVILAHHVADDAGGLDVGAVRQMIVLLHGKQDPPMHGLEAVAHVGQSARYDHAHGVIEIGALHLVGDGDGADAVLVFESVVVIGQLASPRARRRAIALSSSI